MRHTGDLSRETLGYDIHTNRELGFMLKGVKPLAIFYELVSTGFLELVVRYMRLFDLYVSRGHFEKCEYVELFPRQAFLSASWPGAAHRHVRDAR